MPDPIEIRPLTTADDERLTACFRRCYGDTYGVAFFYDAHELRSHIADGRLFSLVAVTAEGEIVGHMGLMRPHPGALTVELGNSIVDPRYRGQALVVRLGAALVEACRGAGAIGYHHYPTTAHTIIQKYAVQAGGVETGVMLSYIPEETDYRDLRERSATGRLAVVTVYHPLADAPVRNVYLPLRYASLLRTLYERARLERVDGVSTETLVPATVLRTHVDPRRSLLRIQVDVIGTDVSDRIEDIAVRHAADLMQVDFLLSDPATPFAVEAIRGLGFFFCALMPEFATGDVLRLQRLREEPRELPVLVYDEARSLLAAALADREDALLGATP